MKKNTIYWLFIPLFLILSCSEYLDIKPYGKAIPKNADEFASILHARLNDIDYGSDEVFFGNASSVMNLELFSDNFDASLTFPGGRVLPIYVGSRINNMQKRYEDLYAYIRDANIILNNMPEGDSEEERKVLGTAYAMRAISNFNLLRDFCEPYLSDDQLGLPLVTYFDMEERPLRSTYRQSISLIESDLKKAIDLGVNDDLFRLKEDVAKFYLTRLYFWTKDWKGVKDIGVDLLKKYPIVQGEEYTTMIQSTNELNGNVLLKSYLFRGASDAAFADVQSYIRTRPLSKEFVDLFVEKEEDIRFGLSFDRVRLNEKVISSKIRTDEVLFMLAEAHFHLGETGPALDLLNELKSKRINLYTPLTLQDLPEVDKDATIKIDAMGNELSPLIQAILNERRKELYAEGDRWYELKRNGRPSFWTADNGLKYETKEYLYTFPLPRVDVELVDGLIQNKGYE